MVSSLKRHRGAAGTRENHAFRFGIEEEYFLADAKSMIAVPQPPAELFQKLGTGGEGLSREMLQAQLEVASRPHSSPAAARTELEAMRQTAADAAARHGLAVMACGTLPLGNWREAVHT